MNLLSHIKTVAVLAAALGSAAQAAVTVSISQTGPDVVAVTSGTFDPTGLTPLSSGDSTVGFISPSDAGFSSGPPWGATPTLVDFFTFTGVTGPASFGIGGFAGPSAFTGDPFYIWEQSGLLGVPTGYVSGNSLSATMTFANSTFASLGLTPGSYVFTTPADTITLNIGDTTGGVPEPSTWTMMLLGFAAIGLAIRKTTRSALAQIA